MMIKPNHVYDYSNIQTLDFNIKGEIYLNNGDLNYVMANL